VRSKRADRPPVRSLGDVATAGHVKFGRDWPTLDVAPDPVSVLAEQRARQRLFFEEMLGGRWKIPDTWSEP